MTVTRLPLWLLKLLFKLYLLTGAWVPPCSLDGKESACNAEHPGSIPGWGRSREWQPTPAFLPGEVHGQRSLGGYSPRDQEEWDTTDRLTLIYL